MKIITRNCYLIHSTQKAYQFKLCSSKEVFWIPKHLAKITENQIDYVGRMIYYVEFSKKFLKK